MQIYTLNCKIYKVEILKSHHNFILFYVVSCLYDYFSGFHFIRDFNLLHYTGVVSL